MRRPARVDFEDRARRFGPLAARVVARRAELGLRQDEVAALAGVGLNTLVDLERGRVTVRLDKVAAIVEVLGMHLELVEGVGEAVVAAQPPAAGSGGEGQ